MFFCKSHGIPSRSILHIPYSFFSQHSFYHQGIVTKGCPVQGGPVRVQRISLVYICLIVQEKFDNCYLLLYNCIDKRSLSNLVYHVYIGSCREEGSSNSHQTIHC